MTLCNKLDDKLEFSSCSSWESLFPLLLNHGNICNELLSEGKYFLVLLPQLASKIFHAVLLETNGSKEQLAPFLFWIDWSMLKEMSKIVHHSQCMDYSLSRNSHSSWSKQISSNIFWYTSNWYTSYFGVLNRLKPASFSLPLAAPRLLLDAPLTR